MEGKREEILRPPLVEEAPWLVYTHGDSKHKQIQTFWNMFSSPSDPNKMFTKSILALRNKFICATCHGWLILRNKNNLFSLWNPVNLRRLLLPPLPTDDEDKLLTCLLTSPPDSDGCVLFLFFQYHVFSCHPRLNSTCSWVTQRIELDGQNAEISLAVTDNGIIYGRAGTRDPTHNGVRHYMVSMEVADDASNTLTLESLKLRDPDCNYVGIHREGYLVESCGHIYYVGIFIRHAWGNRISEVKVWELQLLGKNNNKWTEMKSLDGRAFFVENDCCTWCWGCNTTESSSSGGRCIQGNCVYFLVPSDVDILYSYSLDENRLTVHWRCLDLPTPFSLPVWINVVPQPYNNLLDMQDIELQECMTRQINKNNLDHGSISNNSSNTELREGPLENETREDSRFTNLPVEMVQLVSRHMHIFDYWNFRASCKTFQSVVSPIYKWRAKNCFPLFMFFKNDYGLCEVMDPCREDSHSKILKVSPDPFIVDFSKDGWLVLLNFAADSMEFCNPITRIRGVFPPINRMDYIRSIGFSTYPTSPDCVTVAFSFDFDAVIIYYHQHGNETWKMCEFYPENNDIEFSVGTSSPVYFAGAFYVLDREDGCLGSFELVDGKGSWKVYDKPLFRFRTKFHSCHLVECGEQLVAVFIGHMGTWIQVFKFNHLKKEWTQVESLGNHYLFISHTSSFSTVTSTKEGMKNRIYISRLKGNRLIFYSLETGKYHVDVSTSEDNAFKDFNDTTEPLHPCWI